MVITYFSILCQRLYQTHTFSNNLNGEEIETSRLVCELHYETAFFFHNENIRNLFQWKNQ